MLHIRSAKYLSGFKLWLVFDDDTAGQVDLDGVLTGPIFDVLKDVDVFKKVAVDSELGTVIWPNGADLAPEFLKDLYKTQIQNRFLITSEIYKYKKNQPVVWYHKKVHLSNQFCFYCGEFVGFNTKIKSDKEHLIGREFVPSGFISDKDFNLIFRACVKCNNEKSNLERHISTVTLFNCPERFINEELNSIALNKSNKDYHPDNRGKFVSDSFVKSKISLFSSVININAEFVGPPQLNEEYVEDLAYRHMQGMFSLLSSENPCDPTGVGTKLLPFAHFHLLGIFPKNDWGNPQISYLIERTSGWEQLCLINVAEGFFKIKILRAMHEHEGWFWALEWNKQLRVVGAIANGLAINEIYADMPLLTWSPWVKNGDRQIRYRRQNPIGDIDKLFSF